MVTTRGAPLLLLRLEQGGVEQSETPCLRFWMYQRFASDWICSSLYLSGPLHFVHQDSMEISSKHEIIWWYGVVNGSCSGWCWNIDPGMACSYTLWEGSRGQNVVVLFAFCKVWFETIPCYDKNRTPKRYASLYDNKKLYQLKSIE